MVDESQRLGPLRAELPEYSVDWRFLLPIRAGARILVLCETWQDLSAYFAGLEMHVISSHFSRVNVSPVDLQPIGLMGNRWGSRVIAHPSQPPFAAASFDTVAIPFGIPETLLRSNHESSGLRGLKRLLHPGGTLLIGFSSHWGFLRRRHRMGIAATPTSIRRRMQEAGFRDFSLYGVVPNLDRPTYILPLRKRPLDYFLRHRLLGRPSGALLHIFPTALIWRLIRGLLPGYILLAEA